MSRERIDLIAPTVRLADAFRELAHEHLAAGDARYQRAAGDVAAFVESCRQHADGRDLPAGWVPQSTFWMVGDDARILGCARLRHELTPSLSHEGGHIGYDIRPRERGKGYGTTLLRLTLHAAHERGLAEVLITADEANRASWRVIERNGGRREEGRFFGTGGAFRRYRVSTKGTSLPDDSHRGV